MADRIAVLIFSLGTIYVVWLCVRLYFLDLVSRSLIIAGKKNLQVAPQLNWLLSKILYDEKILLTYKDKESIFQTFLVDPKERMDDILSFLGVFKGEKAEAVLSNLNKTLDKNEKNSLVKFLPDFISRDILGKFIYERLSCISEKYSLIKSLPLYVSDCTNLCDNPSGIKRLLEIYKFDIDEYIDEDKQ